MKKFLVIASLFLLFTGCANPTISRIHHPLDKPEKSRAETVKYEGITPKTISRELSFESRTDVDTTLFSADRFCYDPQNDYVVIPKARDVAAWQYDESLNGGLYVVIPKDSITMCKDGFKNNSYFSRNHALHGLVIGAVVGGGLGAIIGVAGGWMVAFMAQDGGVYGSFILASTAIGAVLSAPIGLFADGISNAGHGIEDIEYRCSSYFTESELISFLNNNRCY